ncbi:MAG: copper homeostasis periplasmic binding protein CopC [Croceibacterium sp.]
MNRFLTLIAIGTAATLATASPALAHAKLVKSNPVANSTVHVGPKSITLTFDERLVPAFSKFDVTMPAHKMNVPVKTVVSPDGKRIVGTLGSRLTAGAYKVTWTAAAADDGHKMTGELSFKVG